MRAMFGLVSLLVVVAIIAYLFSIYSIPAAKVGKKAQVQSRQISGHDEDGTPADRTVSLDADLRNNKLQDLVVTKVIPGGAMDRFYGFQVGDKITAIGGMDISMLSNDDFETARAMLLQEGYEKSKPVTVIRNGVQLQLPNRPPLPPPSANTSSGNSDSGQKSIVDQLKAAGAEK